MVEQMLNRKNQSRTCSVASRMKSAGNIFLNVFSSEGSSNSSILLFRLEPYVEDVRILVIVPLHDFSEHFT